MRHRLVLSYEALAENMGADDVLRPVVDAVAMPDVPLRERAQPVSGATWTGRPR
jgi:MoxR-like ATPase